MTLADRFIDATESPLSRVLGTVRRAEAYLTPKDDWVEGLRRRVFVALDPVARLFGRPLVTEVNDEDYVCTVDIDDDAVEQELDPRYQRNTTSTRKYRIVDATRQWAVGSYVLDPIDEPWQHHAILFPTDDGGTDLYAHKEASVRRPSAHDGGDEMVHGDPDGHLRAQLTEHDVSFDT